jgi:hypothetical protein
MSTPLLELEGTWEEVAAHAPELAGRRVRLFVLPPPVQVLSEDALSFRPPSGVSLFQYVGSWEGDDRQDCLDEVVNSRGPALYDTEE